MTRIVISLNDLFNLVERANKHELFIGTTVADDGSWIQNFISLMDPNYFYVSEYFADGSKEVTAYQHSDLVRIIGETDYLLIGTDFLQYSNKK